MATTCSLQYLSSVHLASGLKHGSAALQNPDPAWGLLHPGSQPSMFTPSTPQVQGMLSFLLILLRVHGDSAWAMVKHKILTRNEGIFAMFFNQQLTFFYAENTTQGTAVPCHCPVSAPGVQVQTKILTSQCPSHREKVHLSQHDPLLPSRCPPSLRGCSGSQGCTGVTMQGRTCRVTEGTGPGGLYH